VGSTQSDHPPDRDAIAVAAAEDEHNSTNRTELSAPLPISDDRDTRCEAFAVHQASTIGSSDAPDQPRGASSINRPHDWFEPASYTIVPPPGPTSPTRHAVGAQRSTAVVVVVRGIVVDVVEVVVVVVVEVVVVVVVDVVVDVVVGAGAVVVVTGAVDTPHNSISSNCT